MKKIILITSIIEILSAVSLAIIVILRFNQLSTILLAIIAFYFVFVGGYFLMELSLNLKIKSLDKQIKKLSKYKITKQ
jgi:hypothetical protein